MDKDITIRAIIVSVIVVIIGIVVIVQKGKPVDYNKKIVDDGVVIEVEGIPNIETVEKKEKEKEKKEDKKEEVITPVKMMVTKVRETGPKIVLTTEVGDDKIESIVEVTYDTKVYDTDLERMVGPYALKEGVEIVYYGPISYGVGAMEAEMLVVGTEKETVKYGRVKSLYLDESSKSHIISIEGKDDLLRVDEFTLMQNITSGKPMQFISMIPKNGRVFYKPTVIERELDGVKVYEIDKLWVAGVEVDELEEGDE